MEAILFDIDGTLADNSHRQYLVRVDKPNWEKFFDEMHKDELNTAVAALLFLIQSTKKYSIILVSARPEKYRDQTVLWLERHRIVFEKLYMRPDGDRRSDSLVKKDMLDDIIRSGYKVLFSVDDRDQTVKMWRENGITCLQCADHSY